MNKTSKVYYKAVYGILVKITVEYDATILRLEGREVIDEVNVEYDHEDYVELNPSRKALFDSQIDSLIEFYGH